MKYKSNFNDNFIIFIMNLILMYYINFFYTNIQLYIIILLKEFHFYNNYLSHMYDTLKLVDRINFIRYIKIIFSIIS